MAKKKREVVRGEFTCSDCSKTYTRITTLHRHQRAHRGEVPFHCDVCSKSFFDSYNLKVHLRTHTGEKPIPCPSCRRRFADKSQLLHHQQMVHSGEKPFTCEMCDKSFAIMWSYNLHMRYHKDERRFECPYCPKKFTLSHALKRHLASHSNVRPFTCPECDRSYPSRHYLTIHRRQAHNIRALQLPGEDPDDPDDPSFTCPDCCASFPTEAELDSHLRLHEILNQKCHSLFDMDTDLLAPPSDSPPQPPSLPPSEDIDPAEVLEDLLAPKETSDKGLTQFDPLDAAEEFDAAQGLTATLPKEEEEEGLELPLEDDCSELIERCIEEDDIDLGLIEELGEEGERLMGEEEETVNSDVIIIEDEPEAPPPQPTGPEPLLIVPYFIVGLEESLLSFQAPSLASSPNPHLP